MDLHPLNPFHFKPKQAPEYHPKGHHGRIVLVVILCIVFIALFVIVR